MIGIGIKMKKGPVAGIPNPGAGCAAYNLCLAQGCGVHRDTGYIILSNRAPEKRRLPADFANRFRVITLTRLGRVAATSDTGCNQTHSFAWLATGAVFGTPANQHIPIMASNKTEYRNCHSAGFDRQSAVSPSLGSLVWMASRGKPQTFPIVHLEADAIALAQ